MPCIGLLLKTSKPSAVHASLKGSGSRSRQWLPCRAVLTIQSYRRMLPVRRHFLRTRSAAVSLQAGERGRKARRDYKELRQRHRAAIRVQARTCLTLMSSNNLPSMRRWHCLGP